MLEDSAWSLSLGLANGAGTRRRARSSRGRNGHGDGDDDDGRAALQGGGDRGWLGRSGRCVDAGKTLRRRCCCCAGGRFITRRQSEACHRHCPMACRGPRFLNNYACILPQGALERISQSLDYLGLILGCLWVFVTWSIDCGFHLQKKLQKSHLMRSGDFCVEANFAIAKCQDAGWNISRWNIHCWRGLSHVIWFVSSGCYLGLILRGFNDFNFTWSIGYGFHWHKELQKAYLMRSWDVCLEPNFAHAKVSWSWFIVEHILLWHKLSEVIWFVSQWMQCCGMRLGECVQDAI